MTDLGFIAATGGEVLCFLFGIAVVFFVVVSNLSDEKKPTQHRSTGPSYAPPPPQPPTPVPDFMVRGQLKTREEGGHTYQLIETQVRGRVPVSYPQELGILITLEDDASGRLSPVYSMVAKLTDPDTHVYRHFCRIGNINPGAYLTDWVPIGFIPVDFVLTPYSGPRRLRITCRCLPATFETLPLSDERLKYGVICEAHTYYSARFSVTGYLEVADKHREGMVATVELALACACADGTVDQRELRVVHRWMTAALTERSDDAPDELAKLKAGFNDAMKAGVRGGADVRSLCAKIHKLSLPSVSQSALTLCVDVIAADGELHADELKTVRAIARDLGLDYDKLQSLIDKQFVNSNVTSAQENLEAIVGIDPSWDKERIRKHLADQFMKWNSRAPAAKSVEDQSRIRSMLDAIARLKKKYS
jgi:tellurite resistance protein